MPYQDTDLDCSITVCSYNRRENCNAEEHVDDLWPDNINCPFFRLNFKKPEDTEDFETMIKESGIPYLVINSDSTHFQTIRLPNETGPRRSDFVGIVRGTEQDISEFIFWKSADGELGCTHNDQLKLDL